MPLGRDGGVTPPPAIAGTVEDGPAAPPRRVPAGAILAIGRRIGRTAALPVDPPPQAAARPRMPRKHKLMLLTAAAVLYTGSMEARRHFKPRAVLIEVPSTRAHAIAALPSARPAA